MKLSDLKPRLKRRNGRWYCKGSVGLDASGETPFSAFMQWRLQHELDRIKREMDEARRLPFQTITYPFIPRYVDPVQNHLGWPPGTVYCGSH